MFEAMIGSAAFLAGAIASVAGFGIGSILTPLLSLQTGTRLAVAAISIPHLVATFVRFWLLRRSVDRRVLVNFGIVSACGGLVGALLHSKVSNPALTFVFAVLLIFAGVAGITGFSGMMSIRPRVSWIAGAASGILGGLAGNQGGIRSAALLGFGLNRQQFVATATAVGLIVDAARMPVYFWTEAQGLRSIAALILITTAGVLAGTLFGAAVLQRIPEKVFSRTVGIMILGLGIFMLVRAIQGE